MEKSGELGTKQEDEENAEEVKKSENETVTSLVCIIRCLEVQSLPLIDNVIPTHNYPNLFNIRY